MSSHFIDRIVAFSLNGKLPLVFFLLSIVTGTLALTFMPREEEPQIVVPVIDVWVEAKNLSSRQVERQVAIPLENLLTQIPGVENVYSTSIDGRLSVTLRFYVGEDREDALLNTYNKLYSNQNLMPAVVSNWQVKPIEVDDVPILMLGLYSTDADLYSDFELRRIADEMVPFLQRLDDTSEVNVSGGRPRALQIELDSIALAARQTSALEVVRGLQVSNHVERLGELTFGQKSIQIESGDVFRTRGEIEELVINVVNGKPIYIKDIANVIDGPSESTDYQWLEFANSSDPQSQYPLVTVSVAKQKGSNAVTLANEVLSTVDTLKQQFLPAEVQLEVLRNYGQTADEKVNNLTASLAFAVFTVVVFIGVFLGWRAALIVAFAIPVCYGLTLSLDWIFGYTINRVTLFALILSLGLLVDDPITGIDNISRFLSGGKGHKHQLIGDAMSEIRPALLMSTLTIMLAFIPLAFITGMMGPYMAPMAFNVPVSVALSTLVAFVVTPWLSSRILQANQTETVTTKPTLYGRLLTPLIADVSKAKLGLWLVLILFVASCCLPLMRAVPLKLLPFDNKNEVQVLIDMPEGSPLEETASVSKEVAQIVKQFSEVDAIAVYVGAPSPIDFNGMVRQYYQRIGNHLAELRVTLIDKTQREHQSHGIVLRLRKALAHLQTSSISIKVVEVPPGPPVMSTLVAEVYADPFVSHEQHQAAAQQVINRLKQEPFVVEVDSSMVAQQQVQRFVVDKQKAALSGISSQDVSDSLHIAVSGLTAGIFQRQSEMSPVPIEVKLPFAQRTDMSVLASMQVKGMQGMAKQQTDVGLEQAPQTLVSLAELGQWHRDKASSPILRKDLRSVIYVTAELSGRTPAEIIADVSSDMNSEKTSQAKSWDQRNYLNSGGGIAWSMPAGTEMTFSGEGEWKITIDVFRDMGIAFAFALLAIFFVLKFQTNSTALALIIMSSIPLTIIGVMPGFWLLNQFGERTIAGAPEPILFTATAMIGMIALAGIVVRNSLILVEFISIARGQGMALKEALIQAGAVRLRPVLLTAGTTMLGNLVITLDPVFSGLALAIIFGIIASTLFSLFVVPMVYFLVFRKDDLSVEESV